MTGTQFQYRVEVRVVTLMEGHNHFSDCRHEFSFILRAIEFCATHSPYDEKIPNPKVLPFSRDWVIDITLQGVILETLVPADWKSLRKPEWKQRLNEGQK